MVKDDGWNAQIEGTKEKCPRCKDKPGPQGIRVDKVEEVRYLDGLLVVFDEHEIQGVPDFRDLTAIHRRRLKGATYGKAERSAGKGKG